MTAKPRNPLILAPTSDAPHPRSWSKLATLGDCRRGLRFLFMEVKRNRMDARRAGALTFIINSIVRTIELEDLERRIAAIEAEQDGGSGDRTIHITVEGRNDEA